MRLFDSSDPPNASPRRRLTDAVGLFAWKHCLRVGKRLVRCSVNKDGDDQQARAPVALSGRGAVIEGGANVAVIAPRDEPCRTSLRGLWHSRFIDATHRRLVAWSDDGYVERRSGHTPTLRLIVEHSCSSFLPQTFAILSRLRGGDLATGMGLFQRQPQ